MSTRSPTAVTAESGRDRRYMVREAGYGRLSFASMLAGVLVGYGAFALLVGIAGAVAEAVEIDTDISRNDWDTLGVTGGLIVAGVLFVSWLFGGYVAGRMARRRGTAHGVGTFVMGVVLVAVAAALVAGLADGDEVSRNLRNIGLPTTGEEWKHFFTVAGVASLIAMFVGALFGGVLGERWHTKLTRRAADDAYGPDADRRDRDDDNRDADDRRLEGRRDIDLRDHENDRHRAGGSRLAFWRRRRHGDRTVSVEDERTRS